MNRARGGRHATALTTTRALWGTLLFVEPARVTQTVSQQRIDRGVILFTRALGARHLVQAAVTDSGQGSSRAWVVAGAAVDATHAVTMVALAVLAPDRRRLALINAATAAAFALTGIREALPA